ncbi:MAG: serine/threonine-protein phosphatase [Planctomycetaceae bacterium]|nr:serine/threonine-protein phosphatase [Planctomycetales bacterium]MCB9921604.1 serine/threonine-protein phosphatase [Planctomycetaceae bacterium]
MSNQDRCVAEAASGVFMVADGVGGRPGGEQAAEIVVRAVAPRIAAIGMSSTFAPSDIHTIVGNAIQTARREMVELAGYVPDYRQMGTTMAMAFVVQDHLCVSHVGDCRAYLLHDQRLTQLTVDQTFVQVAVDAGMLTADQARHHPWRHIVTNVVGVKPLDQAPDLIVVDLAPGDRVLLCTDGLTGVLDHSRLRELLLLSADPQTTASRMIEEALDADSRDNITCVVFDLAAAEAQPTKELLAVNPCAA